MESLDYLKQLKEEHMEPKERLDILAKDPIAFLEDFHFGKGITPEMQVALDHLKQFFNNKEKAFEDKHPFLEV